MSMSFDMTIRQHVGVHLDVVVLHRHVAVDVAGTGGSGEGLTFPGHFLLVSGDLRRVTDDSDVGFLGRLVVDHVAVGLGAAVRHHVGVRDDVVVAGVDDMSVRTSDLALDNSGDSADLAFAVGALAMDDSWFPTNHSWLAGDDVVVVVAVVDDDFRLAVGGGDNWVSADDSWLADDDSWLGGHDSAWGDGVSNDVADCRNVVVVVSVVNHDLVVSVGVGHHDWVLSGHYWFSSDNSDVFLARMRVSHNLVVVVHWLVGVGDVGVSWYVGVGVDLWLRWLLMANMRLWVGTAEVGENFLVWWQVVLDNLLGSWSLGWINSQAFLDNETENGVLVLLVSVLELRNPLVDLLLVHRSWGFLGSGLVDLVVLGDLEAQTGAQKHHTE